jgi:glycosyltransferase involved in cell wall biosynthesis
MTISGFSFVRNGVLYDYPFLESIRSILPLCDEFILAVGNSSDDTLARVRALNEPKIKIVDTVWDDSLRSGGAILAHQTDIALRHTTGDWAFYLQADEVVHEKDLSLIRDGMEKYLRDKSVEGLLFKYLHFYGSYRYVGDSRRWYRREIRILRNGIGAHSWGDAQGFRIDSRKMKVRLIDATIYHYGWVKRPDIQQRKQRSFNRLWHSDDWISDHIKAAAEYNYSAGGKLQLFQGTHPRVMQERVRAEDWNYTYDEKQVSQTIRERFLDWLERKTGYRPAEYKNYIKI